MVCSVVTRPALGEVRQIHWQYTIMEDNPGDKKDEAGIYIVIENSQKQPKDNYKDRSIKIMSCLHILCGLVAMSVGAFKLILKSGYQRNEEPFITSGEGLWFGVIFMVTGLVGIISLKKTTYCKISAFLVLSIFSSLFGFFMIIITHVSSYRADYKQYQPALVGHYILYAIGFIELVLGIVSSSFSCHACCGCCGSVGGDAGVSGGNGGSSVVYVPSSGDVEGNKPRVVHLNFADIKKGSVAGAEDNLNVDIGCVTENSDEEASKAGKYSRFK